MIALFLFAIRLLGTATSALSPLIESVLGQVLVGDVSSLGVAWLASYALGNGSVVAALALSLFSADLLTPSQLFMMVAGSRLGSAAVVLFIGALDWVQKRRLTLEESLHFGLLAFVLTASVYLPATVIGYVSVPWFRPLLPVVSPTRIGVRSPSVFEPLAASLTRQYGAGVVFLLAIALVFASLELFDRVFDRVDTDSLRSNYLVYLDSPWLSFAVGLLVTGVTTSVAFSLGVVVPLFNRQYVTRREIVPYVLGANVGTLVDTLVVAVVLESPVGVSTVLLLVVLSALLSVLALASYDAYYGAVESTLDAILSNRAVFALALTVLVAVPLGLAFVQ